MLDVETGKKPQSRSVKALIQAIDAFCAKHGMSDARFGELAMKDNRFVYRLRNNRRGVRIDTADRIRDFMRKHKRSSEVSASD